MVGPTIDAADHRSSITSKKRSTSGTRAHMPKIYQKFTKRQSKDNHSFKNISRVINRFFYFNFLTQAIKYWLFVGSPFILFYMFGSIFQSSFSYYIKAMLLVLMVIGVNVSGRLCFTSVEATMESLPISVYLATKVYFYFYDI